MNSYAFEATVKSPSYRMSGTIEALTERAAKAQVQRDVSYEMRVPVNKINVKVRTM